MRATVLTCAVVTAAALTGCAAPTGPLKASVRATAWRPERLRPGA
ncbi:hypothetical protein [Streptomyces sp. NPDC018693]